MADKRSKYIPNKNKKKRVKKLERTEGLNTDFGQFDESTGGGHPFEKGNTNTRTTQENGKQRHSENPTTDQPRDGGGRFTYKSVNGESINPKYGPSRGKTVPPTLLDGKNTKDVVYIKDVEEQFGKKQGELWDKYKDRWYRVGGKVVTKGLHTRVSGEAVWNVAKEYDSSIGEYRYYQDGKMKTERDQWTGKSGRPSATEKKARTEAKDTKDQQFVMSSDNRENRYIESTQDAAKGKFDPNRMRKNLMKMGFSQAEVDSLTDEELKDLWDKFSE